tara:strand:- start:24 stop:812 length:789 start_codon:yes stop_codon:yes gene_type:complete
MKKKLLVFAMVLLVSNVFAQDKLYLVFEMMKVDNEQEMAYMETENFWEKIHQQRVQSDEIIGWDLWQLLPGGEDQGYQYMTVTLYDNPVSMFKGGDLIENAKRAYPNMKEEDLLKKLNNSAKTRDLAVRIYLEDIANTVGANEMPIGTVAFLDFMKVDLNKYEAYEKAEMDVFQPMHQKQVDDGEKKYWSLMRIMLPVGSDTYASHITVNMFDDVESAFSSNGGGNWDGLTDAQQKAIQAGLDLRDMKVTTLATLLKKVKKN